MKGERGTRERRGWGGVGEHMCGRLLEFASSLRKNYKAVTLEFFIHTLSLGGIITPVIRSSLKD